MSFLWNIIQQSEIDKNKRATDKSIEKLESEVAELTFIVESMWDLLKQTSNLTDQQLQEGIEEMRAQAIEETVYQVKLRRGSQVKCPVCSQIFSTTDLKSWDGTRHLPCDTLIELVAS